MFILTHEENNCESGIHTTTISISENKENLEKKIEKIKSKRAAGSKLYEAFVDNINKNPDQNRKWPHVRSNAETNAIDNYKAELHKDYPFWYLEGGSEGEDFIISTIEVD